jgi:hypothetical protein
MNRMDVKFKKRIWEGCLHFTVIWVTDTTSRKKTLICMRNKVKKLCSLVGFSVSLLMGVIHEVHRWDDLRCHDIHNKFQDDRFRKVMIRVYNLNNLRACSVGTRYASHFWSAPWGGLRCHDIHTSSHDDRFSHSSKIKDITRKFWDSIVLVIMIRGIYDVRHWDDVRWHYRYIPISIKVGTFIRTMLRFLSQKFDRLQCWYYWWNL